MKELKGIAKKALLIGIGLGVVTRDSALKISKQLLAKGKANEKEVKDFAKKIVAESKRRQKKVLADIEKESKKAAKMVDARSKRELKKLKAKLKKVRAKPVKKKKARKRKKK